MTTLTSSATITVGAGTTAVDTTTLTVLPAIGTGTGRGRLIHPSLGIYDYPRGPDAWSRMDGDSIDPPIWGSTKTLDGAANTLFKSNIRDTIKEERWTQSIAGELDFVRMLIAMWTNPPDPSVAYVQWYPNYTNAHGYNVILLDLTVGGQDITLTPLTKQGWVRGPMVLRMRIASRIP